MQHNTYCLLPFLSDVMLWWALLLLCLVQWVAIPQAATTILVLVKSAAHVRLDTLVLDSANVSSSSTSLPIKQRVVVLV